MTQPHDPLTGPVSEPNDAPTGPFGLPRKESAALVAGQAARVADLADMSEPEFEAALARADKARRRVERILDNMLIPGAHYGNPKNAFQHPILKLAGAEVLETNFRLTIYAPTTGGTTDRDVTIIPPTYGIDGKTILDPGWVSVTLSRGIMAPDGSRIGITTANCNSREKRFKKHGSSSTEKFTYQDARETLHDCLSIAEKRCKVRLVRGALGLTAWLESEEEMEASVAEEDTPTELWTEVEKKSVYDAAQKKGLGRRALTALVQDTLGRTQVGAGADVTKLLAAIEAWKKPESRDAAADPNQNREASREPARSTT